MSDTIPILREVFDYFASDPTNLHWSLFKIVDDIGHPLKDKLDEQLGLVNSEMVNEVREDEHFLSFYGNRSIDEFERLARIWALEQRLEKLIPEERLKKLSEASYNTKANIEPYRHPALADIELRSDLLVPLSCFSVEDSVLIRKKTGFTVVPPIEQLNSQYWLTQEIIRNKLLNKTFVRLDPFIVHPTANYLRPFYKMQVYGRNELDWDRIENLKEEEHGRWMPGTFSTRSVHTDYAWTPRDAEIHFSCEELPLREDISTRGSRYLHAVYNPEKKAIVHLDGAVRIYNSEEWELRQGSHLRKESKIGKRIKVFLVDSEISRDILQSICVSFFVWNGDVERYLGS